jgi:hypothetical protein
VSDTDPKASVGAAVAVVGTVTAVVAALPAEAVVVIVGTAAAVTVISACWLFGKKIKWNLGPWGFEVSEDQKSS